MTKQEKIMEAIDAYADDTCLYPDKDCEFCKGGYCVSDEDSYKCLMKRLDELGVVRKVERELPDITGVDPYPKAIIEGERGRLFRAGYVAVEPLIEETK